MDNNDQIPVPIPTASDLKKAWVLDETIEDVDKSTQELIFRRHITAAILTIVGAVVCEIIFAYLTIYKNSPNAGSALIAPPLALLIAYNLLSKKVQAEFMEQFALANGMTYQKNGSPPMQGELFNLGHSHSSINLISGAWDGNSLNLFDYSYTIGSGKHKTTYQCTVFEIDYPSVLPSILLIVDRQYFGGITPMFGGWQKLDPEGNFDKTFDLYGKKELEIETLQIFAPDVMQKLLTDYPEFNLEFNGNRLIVFYNRIIKTKAELQKMYALVQYLITKIEPVALRMRGSLEAMQAEMNK